MRGLWGLYGKIYEIRDPIYGFVLFDEWEKEIIDHPAFQRLRRIRQLGMTDMVYPSATHTRFEHSLGTMHLVSLMFRNLVIRDFKYLEEHLNLRAEGLTRTIKLLRLAALLHDIGHPPFSHTSEDSMPINPKTEKPYTHEDYTIEIIKNKLKNKIENNKFNTANLGITVDEILTLLGKGEKLKLESNMFWKVLISSQLDADRSDYLLRDSHHIGVKYGIYDIDRLLNTITVGTNPDTQSPDLAIDEDGWHVAESIILSRYQMYLQVYLHKTRIAYDYHLNEALKHILPDGKFPPPNKIDEFLKWDDIRLYYKIFNSDQEDCLRIKERKHIRVIYSTPESPTKKDLEKYEKVKEALGDLVIEYPRDDSKPYSWYKKDGSRTEIFIKRQEKLYPLSKLSSVVRSLGKFDKRFLYVTPEKYEEAKDKLERLNLS